MTVSTDVRADFPILHQQVNGHTLVYLDNAASAQKPQQVLASLMNYYETSNSNVHRGAHFLSNKATEAFEQAREKIQHFIHAPESACINFTKGTTEGINIVAQSFGQKLLKKGDEVLISGMEHHSNIVPWQIACQKTGATLKVLPVLQNGSLDISNIDNYLTENTKIVSIVYASNALGTINPIETIIKKAHQKGAVVLVDAAQAITHFPIDVQQLECDFLTFSGHKLFGPTGIGVLYGKRKHLEWMDPYQYGGEMIKEVRFEETTFNDLPYKFEAGTPNIADAIGLGAAIDYVQSIGFDWITKHESHLLQYATQSLNKIDGLHIYAKEVDKVAVISFNLDGVHPYDLGVLLDKQGIAIRTGHHCCQPLMAQFGIEGTARASFAFYNTLDEVDALMNGIVKAKKILTN